MSVAWSAYRIAAPAVGMLAPAARFFTPAAERAAWAERLGAVSVEGGCEAWLHAASLGEATAMGPLARALTRARPAARLLATATSATGRARLQAIAAAQPRGTVSLQASFAPIDSPQAVRRFMAGARPARLFLVETELWPHWLLEARAAGVPVAVLSGRLAPGSLARYRRLGRTLRGLGHGLGAGLCPGPRGLGRRGALRARPGPRAGRGRLT